MGDESQTLDEISRAAFALLLKEPFYAHVLAGMPREVSDRTATAAVAWDGHQVRLIINRDFFVDGLSANERVAVLKHEILHVAFRHLFRGKDRDPRIDNLAADLVVNQLISPWRLPETCVTLESFPDLRLGPNKTVEHYYTRLMSLYREMCKAGYEACSRQGEEQQTGDSSPGVTGKRGRKAPDSDAWAENTSAPQSAQTIGRLLGDHSRGDHGLWTIDNGETTMAAGRYATGNVLLRARERMPPHMWSTLPSALVSQLNLVLAERQPKVDWKRMVRIFCASSGRTRIRHTIKRISKRYGTRPGIKVQRLQRLLVAVDTSGSIDQPMLEDFFTEIHGAWKAGASIVVVECDAAVKRSYDYRGKPPKAVKGGGGTEFEPVFKWMRDQRPFDGVLYLTDGYGPAPASRPNCKLLWLIPEGGSPESLPFGPTVRIPVAES
jgi:predicted metal-dependent peptidase